MGFWGTTYHNETTRDAGVQEGIDWGKEQYNNFRPLGKKLNSQMNMLMNNPEASMVGLGAKGGLALANAEAAANQQTTGDPTLDAARLSKIKQGNSLSFGVDALNRRESMWSQLANMKQQGRLAKLGFAQGIMGMYNNLENTQTFQETGQFAGILAAGMGAVGTAMSGG